MVHLPSQADKIRNIDRPHNTKHLSFDDCFVRDKQWILSGISEYDN